MLQNSADLKHLVITSWKERWSEKKWSIHVKKLMTSPSDMLHVSDVLVSQSFIGSSPNALLLRYISYALECGLLSYASVITAVSKHEDLSKIESTKAVYGLLKDCLQVVCKTRLMEDAMELCFSLRMVLKWLLQNIEQCLKRVWDMYGSTAEEIIKLNCDILKLIATKPRTSGLLIIARFAEGGVWSHIETDLAVIKNSSGQHPLHSEISASCHHVSQLSKCSISPKPVYKLPVSSTLCQSIMSLILLEVEERKLTNIEAIVQQLILLCNIHGLSTSNLIYHLIQTCFMGYLDSRGNDLEQEWCAMVFLRLPKIMVQLKAQLTGSDFESPSKLSSKKIAQFGVDLQEALKMLLKLDSLLDTIDQICDGINCLKLLTEQFVKRELITDAYHQDLQNIRCSMIENMPVNNVKERCLNPVIILKAENNIDQLVKLLSSTDFSEPERLLNTFAGMMSIRSFSALIAAATTTGQLPAFANALIDCNDAMKSCPAETSKNAQIRAVLFDITFLMVCYMIKLYGKETTVGSYIVRSKEETPILLQWINIWWTDKITQISTLKSEPEPNRVENLIPVLRSSQEFKLSMTKWNDICMNLPQSMIELLTARQKGIISITEVVRACTLIKDGCPLSVTLSVMAAVARCARLVVSRNDHIQVLSALTEKSPTQVQSLSNMMYNERFVFFQSVSSSIMSDLLPEFEPKTLNLDKTLHCTLLKQTFIEANQVGWINHAIITKFLDCYNMLGVCGFMRQTLNQILKETHLCGITNAVDIVFAVMRFDIVSTTMYLLKYGLPTFFKTNSRPLAAPIGSAIAKLTVASLDIALNEITLQQKSLLPKSRKQNPMLQNIVFDKQQKVRRLFSQTEHDLPPPGSTPGLPAEDPLIQVLSDFMDLLWNSMESNEGGPQADFIFKFIKLSLESSSLLSRTVKLHIPVPMLSKLRYPLAKDSHVLLFAASDMGNEEIRKLAAHAICVLDS
nr:mediator of RNA polymerase II transcription subunit 24-like isoform X1 [Ciona intestinalis]|eukprot:XP_018673004.1 mediator of RNA polymerase II transcription subunit 24-like isoform X1 [Ciona intestinalis]